MSIRRPRLGYVIFVFDVKEMEEVTTAWRRLHSKQLNLIWTFLILLES